MEGNKPRHRGYYAPLSSNYCKDPKVIAAGEKAELLYLRGLAFCAEAMTDGLISDGQLSRFVGAGLTGVKQRADALVRVGLWTRTENGYLVASWLKWNRSLAEIKRLRADDAARKQRGAKP